MLPIFKADESTNKRFRLHELTEIFFTNKESEIK